MASFALTLQHRSIRESCLEYMHAYKTYMYVYPRTLLKKEKALLSRHSHILAFQFNRVLIINRCRRGHYFMVDL